MKGLADEVHNMGLKLGIYSTPWKTSYAGFCRRKLGQPGRAWDDSMNTRESRRDGKIPFASNDAKQWAAWGIDYLKYDWNPPSAPAVDNEFFHKQSATMGDALVNSGAIFLQLFQQHAVRSGRGSVEDFQRLAHHRRHSRFVVEPDADRFLAGQVGTRTRTPGIGTIRTCSSSVSSAGARTSIRRTSRPTSNTRTSASGRCSVRRC